MRKRTKIFCGVMAVLLLGAGCLCFWQRDNLLAAWKALSAEEGEIAAEKEAMDREHMETLEKESGLTIFVQGPASQQCEDLLDGKVSAEEVKNSLGLNSADKTAVTREELVNQCVAELYSCKVDVMANLSDLKREVLGQWETLPESARTRDKKIELGMAALRQCYAYEVEVDDRVEACLEKYRGLLAEMGEDDDVLDLLWEQYCQEKSTEKAFYLDKYMD